MKLSRIIFLLIAAIAPLAAPAQTGRSAYDFLTVPTSSHVYGLGGTNITVIDDDVTLAEQNPALLGAEIDRQAAVSYMHYLGAANFASVRYGQAAGEHAAWAAGLRYLNYGEMQGYESDGTPTGAFTPSDFVFEGTYTHDFTYRLRGGINLKMIYSSYEQYSAFAMAADVGINYYDDEHDMSLSVVFKNMGGQIKRFDRSYDRLPFDIQLGWMQTIGSSPFALSITANNLTRWHLHYYEHTEEDGVQEKELKSTFAKDFFRHLIFGVQYQPSDRIYVDLAYNYKVRSDMSAYQRKFFSGFSVGLGIKTRTFSVGAAYAMPHKSASTLLINLGLQISELL
ncbi:MAG: type IX secretion system protein PorQ [Muribaculaceae bacterium]|nr:type IX secretion system protein PorQ [Muribaculaceae bacterium]